jgi:hypothetical protein
MPQTPESIPMARKPKNCQMVEQFFYRKNIFNTGSKVVSEELK